MPPKTTSAAAPGSEILQDWADYLPPSTPGASLSAASTSGPGPYNYERGRMEKAVRECCVDMVAAAAARKQQEGGKGGKKGKREDVDFLVSLSLSLSCLGQRRRNFVPFSVCRRFPGGGKNIY